MNGKEEVSRYICVTEKVITPFGKVFSHVDLHPDGRVQGIHYSYPGKFEDTTIGDAIEALSGKTREMIREI
jgi:hypothetical protein|tara:strand:+ start:745 stop:957 length:213 start_codon:yes stop_codon:yes gene_type:complete